PPTSVRIFVQGNVLEVFVGDQVALVSRMYDRPSGTLGLVAENGSVTFEHVRITDR
ncbi:MAG: GH32 C-terminal domain-containing protein, partial [Armatimonadetes bacterium]|nr:GH32 C-terminal domain-containing protein [Armatimonadota bacterium]